MTSTTGTARRRSRAEGFTLIEVLVALVILATGLVLVLEALSASLRALHDGRDALCAVTFARDGLDRGTTDWRQARRIPERYVSDWEAFDPSVELLGLTIVTNAPARLAWLSSRSGAGGDGGAVQVVMTNVFLDWEPVR